MEDILTLIKIAKKKGQRSIQLVNQNFRKKEISKDNLLYDGIIQADYKTDEEAAREIFKSDPGNRNYRNAKGKLKQKLLNHLYFLDYDKDIYSAYDKCNYDCLHYLHQCKILINEGANEVAIKLLPQLIKMSIDYECIDIAVEALTLLRNEYTKEGKTTPYQETVKELTYQRKFQKAVHDCEAIYHNILVQVNKSVSARHRALKDISPAIIKIEETAKKFKSASLEVLAAKLQLQYNKFTGNFEANVKLCTAIEKKHLQPEHSQVVVNFDKREVAFNKLYAYFCLKDALNGGAYAEKSMKLFKVGSAGWFNFMEYFFLLMMKDQKYKNAGEIYRKIRTHKNYNLLEDKDTDRWQIYRAYLVFVKDSKLLRWGFDLEELLETKPDFSKELLGYNISTLIIQFLYLLREGKVEEVRKRENDLQQYSSTHLDKRHNYRNSIFIRLLSIVTEKDFNYELIQGKGTTYYKKLVNAQIPGDLYCDMEIIPYEILWEQILDILKTNKTYVHFRFYNASAEK